ncbi:MAG: hypothetical protein SFY92_00675 [Verrucomicrobiae bacterium]|nr:hypothetical protein [Verrucomicrobiae bacterium]
MIQTAAVPMRVVHTTGTELQGSDRTAVRNNETVGEYSAGPYVDPQNPNVRHDAHDIQVVEKSPTWNLRPNTPQMTAQGPQEKAPDSTVAENPMTAEFEQQLERQKAYAAAQGEQLEAMAQKMEITNELLKQAKVEAEEKQQIKGELETLRRQIAELKNPPQPKAERTWKEWFGSFFSSKNKTKENIQ